jgi:hypothetical protein
MDLTRKTADATLKLVEILGGLDSEQRNRAISAAMVLLGEPNYKAMGSREEKLPEGGDGLSPKALVWAKKSAITIDQLEHVFAIESDSVEVIAARAPGNSKRLQTIEGYVLCGLASFLASGDPSFTDDNARTVCKKLGAFDASNHFNYMRGLGNLVGGSKEVGWKLTNPGLSRAAELVKQIAPN